MQLLFIPASDLSAGQCFAEGERYGYLKALLFQNCKGSKKVKWLPILHAVLFVERFIERSTSAKRFIAESSSSRSGFLIFLCGHMH